MHRHNKGCISMAAACRGYMSSLFMSNLITELYTALNSVRYLQAEERSLWWFWRWIDAGTLWKELRATVRAIPWQVPCDTGKCRDNKHVECLLQCATHMSVVVSQLVKSFITFVEAPESQECHNGLKKISFRSPPKRVQKETNVAHSR